MNNEEDMVCEFPRNEATSENIIAILSGAKTIAIVGLSGNKEKASYRIAKYLLAQGYEIIPVNPNYEEILGKKSYAKVSDIPGNVDIVDIFRKPSAVPEIVDDALQKGVGAIWMQEGIVHNDSADKAWNHGVGAVMNKCIYKEHAKWKKQK